MRKSKSKQQVINWRDYCSDYKVYRSKYQCWKSALARGHKVELEAYFKQGSGVRVQLKKGKPRSYHNAKREVELALATPKWVDIEAIANIYANRPEGYHVDHIIPLKGKEVSGLHVPWNLQYLPAKVNMAKRNK